MKEEEKRDHSGRKGTKTQNKKQISVRSVRAVFVDEIDEEDVTGYSENKKKVAIQQTAQTAAR